MNYIGFVYMWINLINGKRYIGSHVGKVDDGYLGSGSYFKNAIKKYGVENFLRQILYFEFYSPKNLCQTEFDLINEYNAVNDINYYNQKNISLDMYKWGVNGKLVIAPFTQKHKDNISKARQGRKDSEETKNKKRKNSGTRNMKYFNNGIKELKTFPGKEPAGWVLGRIVKPPTGKGERWFNNGSFVKRYMSGKEPVGWILGRLGVGGKPGAENVSKRVDVREKIRLKLTGVKKPYNEGKNNPACQPGVGEKISKKMKGRLIFNNGYLTKRFYLGEEPPGWIHGKIKGNPK
jgi:hypothetical protein